MKKKCKKKNNSLGEKGQVTYFILLVVIVMFLLFLFGVGLPMLQAFNVKTHAALEPIIISTIADANTIQDVNAKTAITGSLNAQLTGLTDSQEIIGSFILYMAIFIILLIGIIFFMFTRRNVEQGFQ
jgi:ABC-type transport system involved in multi-copper enzyme maturation permease subunit